MAIYHLSVKCFSRSSGHSAVAAAAYRSGSRLIDHHTGNICDYTKRGGVVHTRLVLPLGAFACDRQALWNQAEAAETRKNSTVARECEIALPAELPRQAQIALAEQFASWLSSRYGFAVDVAVHEPAHANDPRNVHAHLLCSTRELGPDGFGAKCRVLDAAATGSVEIQAWREKWAEQANAALAHHGTEARIDHRRHVDRGLGDLPTLKEGRGPGATRRSLHNVEVRAVNSGLRQALAERAHAVAAEKIAKATAAAKKNSAAIAAREEAKRTLQRVPAMRQHIANEIVSLNKQRQVLKAKHAHAVPRAVAVQARRELEYDHNVIVLAQQRLRDLQAVIEHHPRWWQFMSRRAAKDKLDQLAPHLPDWIRQYQTKFSLAKSALIEDIAAHDLALRTELKLKHEQYKKLDQSAQTAQSLLDASEIDQPERLVVCKPSMARNFTH